MPVIEQIRPLPVYKAKRGLSPVPQLEEGERCSQLLPQESRPLSSKGARNFVRTFLA